MLGPERVRVDLGLEVTSIGPEADADIGNNSDSIIDSGTDIEIDGPCFIAGETFLYGEQKGSAWFTMDFPQTPLFDMVAGIWGSSPDNLFAGGFYLGISGVIMHYDGVSWSEMYELPGYDNPYGIWGSSADNVFVAASGGILHYNGSSWSMMTSPAFAPTAVGGGWTRGCICRRSDRRCTLLQRLCMV